MAWPRPRRLDWVTQVKKRRGSENYFVMHIYSCVGESLCRGIHHHSSGDCKLLYETYEVAESERSNYNETSAAAEGENKVLIKG